jgi:hypothetical protein
MATIVNDVASQSVWANSNAGSYNVTANASGALSVTFVLTNTGRLAVSVGNAHTCGLKADGTLQCWGYNTYGQTNVPSPNANWVQVSAGGYYTCGLKADGTLQCWGENGNGQTNIPTPNANWVQVSAGYYHTCGLKADGTLRCWGDNDYGQAPVITLTPGTLSNATLSQSVTFTATVTSSSTTTGTVQFYDNGAMLGLPVSLSSGKAVTTPSSLAVDSHPITATYSGNANYIGSTSNTYTQTVNLGNATTTTLTLSPNPSTYGQAVVFTATVTSTVGTPTGTINFFDNSATTGSSILNQSGIATTTVSTLSVGTHPTITAQYAGDASLLSSTSSRYTQTVSIATPIITLISSPNPSQVGQSVTFTATIRIAAGARSEIWVCLYWDYTVQGWYKQPGFAAIA